MTPSNIFIKIPCDFEPSDSLVVQFNYRNMDFNFFVMEGKNERQFTLASKHVDELRAALGAIIDESTTEIYSVREAKSHLVLANEFNGGVSVYIIPDDESRTSVCLSPETTRALYIFIDRMTRTEVETTNAER